MIFSRAQPLAGRKVEMHSDKKSARVESSDDAQIPAANTDRFREFEAVVENVEEMIAVVDRDYRYLMANRAFLNHRGARREQIVGQLIADVLNPGVFENTVKAKLDESFQNRAVKYEMKYTYPDLGERSIFISYFPISGPGGVERVVCLLQDITERKRVHELIRQERDRAQSYLDIADVILLALDLEGRITLINRKGCATLGREESELLGRNWFETCLPPRTHRELKAFFHTLLDGELTSLENPVLTSSGEERMIGWRNSLLRGGEGRVIGTLSSGEDITERKQAESALRHLSGKLLHAQDEERRKVARELHDGIGTYVSGLSLALGRIRTFLDEKNPEHQKVVAECRDLIQAAAGEIRAISYLLHPPTMEEMGLGSSLEWLVRGFSGRSGITISLQLAPDIGRLKAETELTIFRVTQEALNNVYRHSGSSTAAVRLFQESDDIVLEIADCGRGLPPRAAGADPDFTVGISGMRERVEELGGKFSIESVAGEGCTVRAALPLSGRS
jgi:PAS domain S-box-containing protein